MKKEILLNFCFPVIFMGVFTYWFFDPPIWLYLLLIPYGLVTFSLRHNNMKKYREKIYNEINAHSDKNFIKAVSMNYMCTFIGESGIGYIYPTVFVFESLKKDFTFDIPYSTIVKVETSKILSKLTICLEDGSQSKFIIEESRWKEVVDCINEQISTFSGKNRNH